MTPRFAESSYFLKNKAAGRYLTLGQLVPKLPGLGWQPQQAETEIFYRWKISVSCDWQANRPACPVAEHTYKGYCGGWISV